MNTASKPPTTQFPHCDDRILHAPRTCEYCDMHPDLQEARIRDGICFTGQVERGKQPCPSEKARSLKAINQWAGNRPMDAEEKARQEHHWEQVKRELDKYFEQLEKK